ncbi:hypothetical protein C8A06_0532 [Microbacteriaceae bacterium MWH-Ta3]|nr:hypothetical protein C8A06_0532 [Microbacteriaceae bacterium MWH-Ta3]
MSDLNEVGDRDGWRCWLCDTAVDPDASVNSDRGPSVDSYTVAKTKKNSTVVERLAHRQCNTMKGKIEPVVPWSPDIFVVDPSPIVASVERLKNKGGREIVARCPSMDDATEASEWLLDRLSRFAPDTRFATQITPGGGQYMLILTEG